MTISPELLNRISPNFKTRKKGTANSKIILILENKYLHATKGWRFIKLWS
jgi:hypothetical protein